MILSVSRRTDIPAFYADWFFERLREGSVCVRNPMNLHQVSRIPLSREVVDCIVFWTKNPAPMLHRLHELDDYAYYFQYTVNAYGRETEPKVPPLSECLCTFRTLSERIGKERVIWRYDPIFLSDVYSVQFHLSQFAHIARNLKDCTEKCVFSFVDIYPSRNRKQMQQLRQIPLLEAQLEELLTGMVSIAQENGMELATCAEAIALERFGISHNSCIDRMLIERITGTKLKVGNDNQRPHCQCIKCDDIGSYNTCPHGCRYCYANFRPKSLQCDIHSPLLCDSIDPVLDKVTTRQVRSYKLPPEEDFKQLSLF